MPSSMYYPVSSSMWKEILNDLKWMRELCALSLHYSGHIQQKPRRGKESKPTHISSRKLAGIQIGACRWVKCREFLEFLLRQLEWLEWIPTTKYAAEMIPCSVDLTTKMSWCVIEDGEQDLSSLVVAPEADSRLEQLTNSQSE
ncbi:hypothetical protein Ancab_003771 [Ancistrocladus abbreviatus]